MNGLATFENGTDWRGPLADIALIPSADGGYSINNAARIALDIANTGYRLSSRTSLTPPKGGAQYHFTLPGSVQGFRPLGNNELAPNLVKVRHGIDKLFGPALSIDVVGLVPNGAKAAALTMAFAPSDVSCQRVHNFMGSPLLYPGQHVSATLRADDRNTDAVRVSLLVMVIAPQGPVTKTGPPIELEPSRKGILLWRIPEIYKSQPIEAVGVSLDAVTGSVDGTIWLDRVHYGGEPQLVLKPPPTTVPWLLNMTWGASFVNGADWFQHVGEFRVTQCRDEGIVIYGTRDWQNYKLHVKGFTIKVGQPAGVAFRVQGLNRYYAVKLIDGDRLAIVKARDEQRTRLATTDCAWEVGIRYDFWIAVFGHDIFGVVRMPGDNMCQLCARDDEYTTGGVGLVVTEGTITADSIDIAPTKSAAYPTSPKK
jgi:hypothetical protein